MRARAALLIAATAVWLLAIELLVNRISLLALLVGAVAVLSWTAVRQPARVARRTWIAWIVALALGAVPVDVWPSPSGRLGIKVLRVVWGLPTPATARRIEAGELAGGGCLMPAHPARYVVAISR